MRGSATKPSSLNETTIRRARTRSSTAANAASMVARRLNALARSRTSVRLQATP